MRGGSLDYSEARKACSHVYYDEMIDDERKKGRALLEDLLPVSLKNVNAAREHLPLETLTNLRATPSAIIPYIFERVMGARAYVLFVETTMAVI